tara:strand:- start:1017 stop:1256 length:240 start_codon:yes stop_codon:yes gene_type:complete
MSFNGTIAPNSVAPNRRVANEGRKNDKELIPNYSMEKFFMNSLMVNILNYRLFRACRSAANQLRFVSSCGHFSLFGTEN